MLSASRAVRCGGCFGVVIVGSPATCRAKLDEYRQLAGFGTVLVKTQFGTLPAELTRKNMEMLASEVFPHFRREQPQAAAE